MEPSKPSAAATLAEAILCLENAGAELVAFLDGHTETRRPIDLAVGPFNQSTWDAAKQNARVEAAFALAGLSANPPGGLTLVGYSAGAGIGEQMVQRWPDRYARVVLIGAPTDPSTQRLKSARAVVTMSCTLDVPWRMKDAARRLNATGVPATYMEMPGCTHGNIADGDRVFDDAFGWLTEHQRPAT